MGLVSLKYEFETLSDLRGTADNARYFLRSINLSPYGYDFRTIRSWSLLIHNIRDRLTEISLNKEAEVKAKVKAEAETKTIEKTEIEEEILYEYRALNLTWRVVKVIDSIKNNILYILHQRFNKIFRRI